MLYNVDAMTKVINRFRRQGGDIPDELLKKLSPFRGQHISLLGTYYIDVDTPNAPPELQLI